MSVKAALRNAMLPALARAIDRPEDGDPQHVLVIQPDHLGDIVLSEPAVRLIRESRPDWRLTAVTGPWSAYIARLAWPVDGIVEVDFPGFSRSDPAGSPAAPYVQIRRDAERLTTLGAGRAVVLRDDAWWAAALARASVSGDVIAAADPRNRRFATALVDLAGHEHRTARALALANALVEGPFWSPERPGWDMSPHLAATDDQLERARGVLAYHDLDSPFIVIHPGAGAAVKTWPARFWRAAAESLRDQRIVLTGSAEEEVECHWIADGLPHVLNLAGKTTLDELIGILHKSRLAAGTDNGPMHVAAALGTPTVRLFGPSNPARYGPPPGSTQHRVISAGWRCPRCEDLSPSREPGCGCMTAIEPTRVISAIREALTNGA